MVYAVTVNMPRKNLFVLTILAMALPHFCAGAESAENNSNLHHPAGTVTGPGLHLQARQVITYQLETGEHVLVFQDGFSMSTGSSRYSSDKAVLWLQTIPADVRDPTGPAVKGHAYLQGKVAVKKSRPPELFDWTKVIAREDDTLAFEFNVPGVVFLKADKRESFDTRELELYKKAVGALSAKEHKTVSAQPEQGASPHTEQQTEKPTEETRPPETQFSYPINIAPAGQSRLNIERTLEPDGTYAVTVIGRFLLWQKQQDGALLELEADSAVVWYSEEALQEHEQARETPQAEGFSDFLAGGAAKAVYLSGDVVMTEGLRTIRAEQLYYDFQNKKGLAVAAEMKTFDLNRQIPIYVRANELRLVAKNEFAADEVTVTTSEFYKPQISLNVSKITVIDTSATEGQKGRVPDSSYDAQMRDVRLKMGDATIFYWPFLRSNLERPDLPIKSVHAGYDSDFGAAIETRWYLSRLLGLRESDATESTLALDFYSERGVGVGADIEYATEDYFGSLLGYVIHDSGEDDLGRAQNRKNLEPPRELRGRFRWQHRHFLPYNWQLTTEVGYLSDEHFLEGFYRNEFYTAKEQETLIHLKRIEDNWGLSILGKVRINDFVNQLEELPSIEYHRIGESLLEDKLTFYSDSRVSRFRQRLASGSPAGSEDFFTLMSERAELDMPMSIGRTRCVPFVAGTVAYEDGAGFHTDLDGRTVSRQESVWSAEAGGRLSTQYWKVYPDVKSKLWDLNRLRHIVRPHLTAVAYTESDPAIEQRDTLQVGVSQRLQTKRGPAGNQRTVDWMRLDMDVTWVNNSGDTEGGPSRFLWNKPFIPLVDTFDGSIPPRDRRSSDVFGPRRDYFGADYTWRLSDTTAVLSDMYFDMQSGVVEQFDIGFSQFRWPDLSYYIGSRYLRRIEVLDEKGSNAVTFAATYKLDPRYTLVFSQQYDFDYDAGIQGDITLIRRYHRIYCGLTFSADQSLERQAIVLSIWPQGVPELAIGQRKYMRLAGPAGY